MVFVAFRCWGMVPWATSLITVVWNRLVRAPPLSRSRSFWSKWSTQVEKVVLILWGVALLQGMMPFPIWLIASVAFLDMSFLRSSKNLL